MSQSIQLTTHQLHDLAQFSHIALQSALAIMQFTYIQSHCWKYMTSSYISNESFVSSTLLTAMKSQNWSGILNFSFFLMSKVMSTLSNVLSQAMLPTTFHFITLAFCYDWRMILKALRFKIVELSAKGLIRLTKNFILLHWYCSVVYVEMFHCICISLGDIGIKAT